jgi:hypothetical protein
LDGARPSEDSRHQVADSKIFDLALTCRRRNPGASQEAFTITISSMMMVMTVASMVMTFASMMMTFASIIIGKCRFRPYHLHHDRNRGHRTDCPQIALRSLVKIVRRVTLSAGVDSRAASIIIRLQFFCRSVSRAAHEIDGMLHRW